jgi:hypothetical protein
METKDQRRQRKLGQLIAATAGGMDAIATAADINPAYLQQIVKGVLLPAKRDGSRSPRSLGDTAAEKIEDAMRLGRGWFDGNAPMPGDTHTSQDTTAWPFETLTIAQWQLLPKESRALVENMALHLVQSLKQTAEEAAPAKQYTPPTRAYASR